MLAVVASSARRVLRAFLLARLRLDRLNCERNHARLALVIPLNELLARSPDAPRHRQIKLCRDAFERLDDVLIHSKPKGAVVSFLLCHAAMFLQSLFRV